MIYYYYSKVSNKAENMKKKIVSRFEILCTERGNINFFFKYGRGGGLDKFLKLKFM